MRKFTGLFCLFFLGILKIQAQEINQETLSFQEFIGFVKAHHPLVKQANLQLKKGEAYLLKARGGFDPKVSVDYGNKDFKDTNYFNELNAVFKVPVWYGIDLKASFEDNEGVYLNPSLKTPDDGLYSAGISMSVQGLLMNERMATLKKARFYKEETKAKRELAINELLYKASEAYFSWLKAANEEQIISTFINNATTRLQAVEKSVEAGDKAAITITEAKLNLQNRALSLQEAMLERKQKALEVSNYLWLNNIPLEIKEATFPENPKEAAVEDSLLLSTVENIDAFTASHPKIKELNAKIEGLEVDVFLKKNKLLPKLNINYNFLSEDIQGFNSFKSANYKAYVNFELPLFLRKQRGDLKLSKLKLQEANFKRMATTLKVKNKVEEAKLTIGSLKEQQQIVETMLQDYKALVTAEERKFTLGESSLFLINYREEKLIQAQIKNNALFVKNLKARAKLYNALGISL